MTNEQVIQTKEQLIQRIQLVICELQDYSAGGSPLDRTMADEAIILLKDAIDALEHRRHPAQLSRQDRG